MANRRNSRPIGHIHHELNPEGERRLILQQLHDAAQIGDVNTVEHIFATYQDIPIDVTRKGQNTTLHTALLHNQEGPLIDYLVEKGANVNAENTKGHCPLILAILHCKGSKAVAKIIAAGATWKQFDSGAFAGLSAMDVAAQHENINATEFLQNLTEDEDGVCHDVASQPRWDRKQCPICNLMVKFPTNMSRIESDQAALEQRVKNDGDCGGGKRKQKKYISRKYMDQLLAHSDGAAYKKLCGIEYHSVENMRLRKEISESYGILHAVQECISGNGAPNSVSLENVFLIDLCSGKGITTALCAALDSEGSNNHFLAIDRMLPHTVPHFLNDQQVQYLCRDVMSEEIFAELAEAVRYQTREQGRTCVLVGMHLCGLLSERAIDLFARSPDIQGLVLSPCCLPRKNERRHSQFVKATPESGEESAELFNYFRWAQHLKGRIEGGRSTPGVLDVRLYTDKEMHTDKNAIIVGVRTSK